MFWQIWGAFYVVGCEGLFVCFEHKSESKSLDVSGPKTICFSDESSLPLWRSFGKKHRVVPKNVLRDKLKAQNKLNMLCTSGQNNKCLLNMLAFCSSEWLKQHMVLTDFGINPAKKKQLKKCQY